MSEIISKAYSAFNRRDIDAALSLMTPDVTWPKASEGGRVAGKEEIRAYWTRQWCEFDPHVGPLAMTEEDGGRVRVRVRQLVRSLQGDILSDSEVFHIFTNERRSHRSDGSRGGGRSGGRSHGSIPAPGLTGCPVHATLQAGKQRQPSCCISM